MKKRKVYAGEVHHVYQKTTKGGLIFYSVHDYLVFFTIFCSQARKREVRVLALCPMPDHIHQVLVVDNSVQLAGFEQSYSHLFALEWNQRRHLKGFLFKHPYGSAVKLGHKQVRTALAYCNNNPVERRLSEKAEDYRWTFLSYFKDRFPYSRHTNPVNAKGYLRYAIQEARTSAELGNYLHYSQLERWEKHLSAQEWLQLQDYIIHLWNAVEYNQAMSYYSSFDSMVRAFHDNTGSEYDIKEERDNYSDEVYSDCTRILISEAHIHHVADIPSLSGERKKALFSLLRQRTSARPKQIRKYLHMPINVED